MFCVEFEILVKEYGTKRALELVLYNREELPASVQKKVEVIRKKAEQAIDRQIKEIESIQSKSKKSTMSK